MISGKRLKERCSDFQVASSGSLGAGWVPSSFVMSEGRQPSLYSWSLMATRTQHQATESRLLRNQKQQFGCAQSFKKKDCGAHVKLSPLVWRYSCGHTEAQHFLQISCLTLKLKKKWSGCNDENVALRKHTIRFECSVASQWKVVRRFAAYETRGEMFTLTEQWELPQYRWFGSLSAISSLLWATL